MSAKRHFKEVNDESESESDHDNFIKHIPSPEYIYRQFSEEDNFLIVESEPVSEVIPDVRHFTNEIDLLNSSGDDECILQAATDGIL